MSVDIQTPLSSSSTDVDQPALLPLETLETYLLNVCRNLTGIAPSSPLTITNPQVLQQYINEPHTRLLQLTRLQQQLILHCEIVMPEDPSTQLIYCIKRTSGTLVQTLDLFQQLQFMTMGTPPTNTNQVEGSMEVLYNYIQQSFGPLVHAYAHSEQLTKDSSTLPVAPKGNEIKIGLPAIQKKVKELELALLQYQQNLEIPQVQLLLHPEIQAAANLIIEEDCKMDLAELNLEAKLRDDTFLNELQAGVNRWIREIQKLTKLTRDPASGNTLQEVNFWKSLEQALIETNTILSSPGIELTLMVLKQAKRFLVTTTFTVDHGLGPALKRAKNCMSLLKDVPIQALLSATDVTQMQQALVAIFAHLKKVKTADQYELSRAIQLVEAISRDLTQQIISVFSAQQLIQLPIEEFERITNGCTQLFQTWTDQFKIFYDLLRDLSRRRGTGSTDIVPLLPEIIFEHTALEERMVELCEFRRHDAQLKDVIERVLQHSDERALQEIKAAYHQFNAIDILDVSLKGNKTWTKTCRAYDLCIDRIEGRIIHNLTDRLAATKTADEMFRVFSKFNALFFRPRIRGAVQQFQMQLIENVKQDVQGLQEKFKNQYNASEAARMSTIRDIPPVSGAILWAKQIERKLGLYMSRVEDVLGTGWEQHVEGKHLKTIATSFRKKINTQQIFDKWIQYISEIPSFEISGIILEIDQISHRSGVVRRQLQVAFDPQIITLFKEVRHLEWLGFRVPYTIKMIAEEAKEKYPYAMSLQASLRTFQQTCQQIPAGMELLIAASRQEVHVIINQAISKHRQMKWDSDGLAEYVDAFGVATQNYQEKVDDLLIKQRLLDDELDQLKTCEYTSAAFEFHLQQLQKLVDEMNLAGYSNINQWVNLKINDPIEQVFIERLENAITAWILDFQANSHKTTGSIHCIQLKNQVLSLDPPLEHARSTWIENFHHCINVICQLPRIRGSTFDTALATKTKASTFDQVFLDQIESESVLKAYRVIDTHLQQVEQYVATWLQYQALWDMDFQFVVSSLQEDLKQWQQLLVDIKHERLNFDNSDQSKVFGSITIDYHHVQTQVNLKYDVWHKDCLANFGQLMETQMQAFYQEIAAQRKQLERHQFDASTQQVVQSITVFQHVQESISRGHLLMEQFISGERLLRKQRYVFPSSWPSLANVEGEWEALQQLVERKSSMIEKRLPDLQSKIMIETKALKTQIDDRLAQWKEKKLLTGIELPQEALDEILSFETYFISLNDQQKRMTEAKAALSLFSKPAEGPSPTLFQEATGNLDHVLEEIAGLKEVWGYLKESYERVSELRDTLWTAVQPRKLMKALQAELDLLRTFPSRVRQYEAYEKTQAKIKAYKGMHSLLLDLKSDALKQRHWKKIFQCLHLESIPASHLLMGHLWDHLVDQPPHLEKDLRAILTQAQGEMGLEEFLKQVREYWQGYQVDLVNYQNRCRLIRGWDDLFNQLEEHLGSLQAMERSPYYHVFAEECALWVSKLQSLHQLFNYWIDVQRRWVYLEGIFIGAGNAEIQHQLPKEYQKFQHLDHEFITLMRKIGQKPAILEVLTIANLYHSLERQNDLMMKIQRTLGEYLEQQRAAFSRFYFVGDEDLLEIIGNGKDPMKLQRHLSKMFAGLTRFEFEEGVSDQVVGMISREGELVRFEQPIDVKKDPRPKIWLASVERQMKTTLALRLQQALSAMTFFSTSSPFESNSFLDWATTYPAQIVILATQISWTKAVEKAMTSNTHAELIQVLERILEFLASCVLNDLPPDRRKKYEQLITEVVHERDVVRNLLKKNITSVNDFTWLYQMRYYYNETCQDLLKQLEIRVANAVFYYGFEYLGVGERLVQTPLTDRCYLTLTQALHYRMGGNPFGPAGTGKTETVKQLGASLGRFVLVFNCDEKFDFQAMGRIFVGLSQVGAWGCFDEFNRLEERVLSAVSQQILTIQTGLSRRQQEIELLGRNVSLHEEVGIFVTMNPGYAGRSNLPDNLKQLFRSIAMVEPDRDLIAQVMLFSQGITSAEAVAGRIVLLFQLCQDQLSSQPHYDFGLRALKSVLVSAGSLKRKKQAQLATAVSPEALVQLELDVLIRSICDTIVPKIVASDSPVFETLLHGVFPDSTPPEIEEPALKQHLFDVCSAQNYVPTSQWIEKALQLYQVLQLRHGVMLVGNSGTGKTAIWRSLLQAMELHDQIKGEVYVIDPKAISKETLYGVLDSTTLEWTDGVFTQILRQILNNVRNEQDKRHWILFDGDVDPEWAENLNSVLDDNKLLTLPSGERLAIPSNVSILIETETLQYATLATVSRCGMVWFSQDAVVSISMIIQRFLAQLDPPKQDDASTEDAETREESVASLLRTFIAEYCQENGILMTVLQQAMELPHIMQVTELSLLTSTFTLVEKGVAAIAEYNESHPDFPMSRDHLQQYATKWFVFSMVWGMAGAMESANRFRLCQVVQEALGSTNIAMPSLASDESSILDYQVDIATGTWRLWKQQVNRLELEPHQILSTDIVIPTVDTLRHVEALRGWLTQHHPFILCGPPGSGKTMTLTSTLTSLSEFLLATINFSSGTTPEVILKTFGQYCQFQDTQQGTILRPTDPEKWLIVFCDEINLPQPDNYATQRVITFLRQLTERNGFWRPQDKKWITLNRIQFVGACNPPTDPGRVPLSQRFLRHVPVLVVDFPTTESLHQIYGTLNQALLKLTPMLKQYEASLTNAMIEIYQTNQQRFTADQHPHYIYSPRELSRWLRALYEALEPFDTLALEELVRVVLHEALRLFHDRLVTEEEQLWCRDQVEKSLQTHFPHISSDIYTPPVLFSSWLSKNYVSATPDAIRHHIEARLRVFYEEELNVPLVVFDKVVENVLRIDRVLRQPLGHLLLVGDSGVGKTVLAKFVAWMNGLQIFQIQMTRQYTLADFDADLRSVLKRVGCQDEKICFIFDESNAQSSAFLERMNSLLASGEVPGLFEDDEYTTLLMQCREGVQRDGLMLDTEEELFQHFTKQIQRNLHVVFTMNPTSSDFHSRSETSPALFNRCVVNWFGTWSKAALTQVAEEFTQTFDLNDCHAQVVQCLVDMHLAMRSRLERLASSSNTHTVSRTSLSPRDFIDLIHHFQTNFESQRQTIQDQQYHFTIGLEKLEQTSAQVASLQQSLTAKRQELAAKEQQANAKLEQMVEDQNEAESKKQTAETLKRDLHSQDETIQSQRQLAQDELAAAEPALHEAQKSVSSIKKQQLDEIRAMARPPPAVRLTLEAVAVMLGESSLEWADLRKFIRKDEFIPSIVNFSSEDLTQEQRTAIEQKYLASDELAYEKVQRASRACGPLFKWIQSQIQYSQVFHRIQPLRDELAALEGQSAALRQQYEELEATIAGLETSIQNYKAEYATLIKETQQIQLQLQSVELKVTRSIALLTNLATEQARWTEANVAFDVQLQTLIGNGLLHAATLTYAGALTSDERVHMRKTWLAILEEQKIVVDPEMTELVKYCEHLHSKYQIPSASLPNDRLSMENAIILHQANRFPLLIDPSGQALRYLQQYHGSKLTTTSFYDASFFKVLASSIRFGTALVVQDVEKIDPILNAVLNHEVYKTGGRNLIHLNGEIIDYSPDFQLYLTTRDAQVQLGSDFASRVTIVNFTMTQQSLQERLLSLILQAECPETDRERQDCVVKKVEYQSSLRECEHALLQTLNDTQGNLLDNDQLIQTLEDMQAQVHGIKGHVSTLEALEATLKQTIQVYEQVAWLWTEIYLVLRQLSTLSSLYQFSTTFYCDLLRQVLLQTTKKIEETQEDHLKELVRRVFQAILFHIPKSLQAQDQSAFVLRMTQLHQQYFAPSEEIVVAEQEYLQTYHFSMTKSSKASASDLETRLAALSPAILPDSLPRMVELFSLPSYAQVVDAFEQNWITWEPLVNSAKAPELHFPDNWDPLECSAERHAFRKLLLVLAVFPDRTQVAVEEYISVIFPPSEFPYLDQIDLREIVQKHTIARRPLLLCSKPGYDPSAQVDALATRESKSYQSIAMGTAEGYDTAEVALQQAIQKGTWVLLRNLHLCGSWLAALEKKLHFYLESQDKKCHEDFRLFLTCDVEYALPRNLTQLCQIFVFEPPVGLKASLLGSFDELPSDEQSVPVEHMRCYFLLAWLRAVVHERLRYVPIGWSKAYEFNVADHRCAMQMLTTWIQEVANERLHLRPDEIPWQAIRTILSESIYGGRIDNDYDQQVLESLINGLFTPECFELSFGLIKEWNPNKSSIEQLFDQLDAVSKTQFTTWISELPQHNPPTWLGLPASAETMLSLKQSQHTLGNLQRLTNVTETTPADVEEARDSHSKLAMQLQEWLTKLQATEISSDLDAKTKQDAITRCLDRERLLAQSHQQVLLQDLRTCVLVCQGKQKPLRHEKLLLGHLQRNEIPASWLTRRCHSLKAKLTLEQFITDIEQCWRQLQCSNRELCELMHSTDGIWLGGLDSPEGFLTAMRQICAEKADCSLEELHLQLGFDVTGACTFVIRGMSLEGAHWQSAVQGLEWNDGRRSDLPPMGFKWTRQTEKKELQFPLYLTPQRSAILFETGIDASRSTSEIPPAMWIQRAVAFTLCQFGA